MYALPIAFLQPLQVQVSTTADVLEVMAVGMRNRAVAETKMNERSSRSHSVLTIMVDGANYVMGERTHGCLHLIDLAGGLLVAILGLFGWGGAQDWGSKIPSNQIQNSGIPEHLHRCSAQDKGFMGFRRVLKVFAILTSMPSS